MPARSPLSCLLLLTLAGGCVHVGARPPQKRIDMPELAVLGDLELSKLNAEELFARGSSAFGANDFEKAARLFDRLADAFPESHHHRIALYNGGLSHERLSQFEQARERFLPLADPEKGTGDALDATFRLAETDYHLALYGEAVEMLKKVWARTNLPLNTRLEALVQQGICELEWGQSDTAEVTLRRALETYQNATDKDEAEDYFPAQAQFFLGEIYRLHFESVKLDPNKGTDKLTEDLELKAELLLSAQGHYLRSIRIGNGYWATAAGAQIGGLYENLYAHMMQTGAPKELNAEEAEVYQQEVRRKIRVLLTKAISVYESTLEAAERIGSSGPFVEKARGSLKKMKDLLLAEAQRETDLSSSESEPEPEKAAKPGRTPTPPAKASRRRPPHSALNRGSTSLRRG